MTNPGSFPKNVSRCLYKSMGKRRHHMCDHRNSFKTIYLNQRNCQANHLVTDCNCSSQWSDTTTYTFDILDGHALCQTLETWNNAVIENVVSALVLHCRRKVWHVGTILELVVGERVFHTDPYWMPQLHHESHTICAQRKLDCIGGNICEHGSMLNHFLVCMWCIVLHL